MSLAYSPAILKNNILFISGKLGVNENNELISDNVLEQFKQALYNLEKILKEYNFEKKDIVKTTIYITDENYFNIVNQEFVNYFNENKPTRTTIIVKALPKDAKVEIEAIAIK